jgi:hypothetical protein
VDAEVLTKAARLADALPPIAHCGDRRRLLADVAPPADPQVAARVSGLSGSLARVEALAEVARHDEARALASSPGWRRSKASGQPRACTPTF